MTAPSMEEEALREEIDSILENARHNINPANTDAVLALIAREREAARRLPEWNENDPLDKKVRDIVCGFSSPEFMLSQLKKLFARQREAAWSAGAEAAKAQARLYLALPHFDAIFATEFQQDTVRRAVNDVIRRIDALTPPKQESQPTEGGGG